MATTKKKKGSKKKASTKKAKARRAGTKVATANFAKHSYVCEGRKVKTGRGDKRVPRVFCHRAD